MTNKLKPQTKDDKLRIALDIDDTIADFLGAYKKLFGKLHKDHIITKNVWSLRKSKEFWGNLYVIDRPDFEPHIYCTKRVNSKDITKKWLEQNDFPVKPIYQIYIQSGNKADKIKGRCDVLIDDSYRNVIQCIESGLPALLIRRDHNKHIKTPYEINTLNYKEIEEQYNKLFK